MHPNYNVLYLAFARPSGSGGFLTMDVTGYPGGLAQMRSDIATVRGNGDRVILSVGGQTGGLIISSDTMRNNVLTSISNIISDLGQIDGVDWNTFEGRNMGTAEMDRIIWISRQLRSSSRYGSNFMITAAPAPSRVADKRFCARANSAGVLSYCAPQFYDVPQDNIQTRYIPDVFLTRSDSWRSYIPANRIVVGLGVRSSGIGLCLRSGSGCYWTGTQARDGYSNARNTDSSLRGVMNWAADTDAWIGNPFATGAGAVN